MKRYLIVTADDFGFSHERNRGIIETFQKSAITSASLLLNCTGTDEAANCFKAHKLCPGLHLNLTEGHSLSKKNHSNLTDLSGQFWGKFELRKLLEDGKIDPNEIQQEIQCQIDLFTKLVGQKPSYVDGHQHVHVHPSVAQIFASTLQGNDIKVTRFPVEMAMEDKNWVPPQVMKFYTEVMSNAASWKHVFDAHNIRYTDKFVGLSTMGVHMTLEHLQSSLLEAFTDAEKQNNAVRSFVSCELMTHPGYPTNRSGGGFDGKSDDFGCSPDRQHEIKVLTSQQMLNFYQDNNIQLVTHKDIIIPE